TVISAIIILSTLLVSAQSNYVTGSLITLEGDTLSGSINNERWLYTPRSIQFKNQNEKSVSYFAKDIKGFIIEGKIVYLSAQVNYDSTSNKVDELPSSSTPAFKSDVVFLRLIVQSKLSMLVYEEPRRTHIF